jgi:signal peptidase I
MKRELIEWIKAIVYAVIIVGVLNIFITTTMVYSTSMYPTLIEKDLLILTRHSDLERGDIVSFESELEITEEDVSNLNIIQKIRVDEGDHKNLIKRVVGAPGDELMISDGQVYINGELYEEDYLNTITTGEEYIKEIPDGKYFLMGDNRRVSLDSRSSLIGLVDEDRIFGEVIFRLYPINRIGTVD